MLENHVVSTWVVFALQIFWDTQREFGHNLVTALDSAQRGAGIFDNTLQIGEDIQLQSVDKWTKNYRQILRSFRRCIKAQLHGDIVEAILKKQDQSTRGTIADSILLLKTHPMLCGLLSQSNMCLLQMNAIAMADSQQIITATAHLYNAARELGCLPAGLIWKYMEYLIAQQNDAIGLRERCAEKPASYFQQFILSIDIDITNEKDATNLCCDSSPNLILPSKYINACSKLDDGMYGISRAVCEPSTVLDAFTSTVVVVNLESQKKEKRRSRKSRKARKAKAVQKLIPVDILANFKKVLRQDELLLRFALMAFSYYWIEMFKLIRAQVTYAAPSDYYNCEDDDMNDLGCKLQCDVIALLSELAGLPTVHGPQIPTVADILSDTIQEQDNDVYDAAALRVPSMSAKRVTPVEEREPASTTHIETMSNESRIKRARYQCEYR